MASGRATDRASRAPPTATAIPPFTRQLTAAATTMPVVATRGSRLAWLMPARDRVMASTSAIPEAAASATTPAPEP